MSTREKKRWIGISLGSLLVISLCFAQEVNFLKNPGFEDLNSTGHPLYYTINSTYRGRLTVVEEKENVHSGKRAIKMETTEESVADSFQLIGWYPAEFCYQVFPDTTYELSAWAKGEGKFYVTCYIYNKEHKMIKPAYYKPDKPDLTSQWKKYKTIFTPPEGTAGIAFVIRLDGKGAWAYVDDVCLKEVEEEVRYDVK